MEPLNIRLQKQLGLIQHQIEIEPSITQAFGIMPHALFATSVQVDEREVLSVEYQTPDPVGFARQIPLAFERLYRDCDGKHTTLLPAVYRTAERRAAVACGMQHWSELRSTVQESSFHRWRTDTHGNVMAEPLLGQDIGDMLYCVQRREKGVIRHSLMAHIELPTYIVGLAIVLRIGNTVEFEFTSSPVIRGAAKWVPLMRSPEETFYGAWRHQEPEYTTDAARA